MKTILVVLSSFVFRDIKAFEIIVTIDDMFSAVHTVSDILVNIFVMISGIVAFTCVYKVREKQNDATFSYLARFYVRLRYFKDTFEKYKDDIMEYYFPQNCRRETPADRQELIRYVINQLSKNAEETLMFLKNENNQLPAEKGWVDNYNEFIGFLTDFVSLGKEGYSKWLENQNELKEDYSKAVLKNIEEMLKMVDNRQKKLEKKLAKQ